MSTLDFNAPPPNHKVSVSIEREETLGEQRVRLFKDIALFAVAIGFVIVVAGICVSTLQSPDASADEKKWAMSVISAATGGIIGYLVRK